MHLEKKPWKFIIPSQLVLAATLIAFFLGVSVWGQVTASITGSVKDASGAVVPGATVTVKHLDTGMSRTAETDANGSYSVPSFPVGQCEVSAEKTGFKQEVRRGINLVVAQQAVVNLTLEVGNVEQQVTVTAEAPIVNTTLSSTSGLVGEKQVKDLPLNGRSFDQLLTLNVGAVNFSSNIAYTANYFSVVGRRPEENRFLLNGVDYIGTNGASGEVVTPMGASGQLLGVDAVREFNLVAHTYGAEYGKRSGGQVSIVTSSGTNGLHGDVFEFLRNSLLDARNFFDRPLGTRIPPFKRNQFGGSLGGPLKKDKLFLFGNYEGFRQRLGLSSVSVVPDAQARLGNLPIGPNNSLIQVPNLQTGMLAFANNFWPVANGPSLGGGLALSFNNPLQKVREDFGLTRFDYNASSKDSLSVNYLIDDGENNLPLPDPNFLQSIPQRSHVLGLQETHVFSPTVLNIATIGFSRAGGSLEVFPTVPIPANLTFLSGKPPVGIIIIGGAQGAASGTTVTATSQNGAPGSGNVRNDFTWSDDVRYVKGNHSLSFGLWAQRVQLNYTTGPPTTQMGPVVYSTLQAFLQDTPTQLQVIPNPTRLGLRSTEAAWYVQDEIKLRPNLTLRMGLRDEMTTGWNETWGRCANYIYDASGIIQTDPLIGKSCLTQNNAIALWQPRVGLAWDPTGTGSWSVRAGFGIYNTLQDNLSVPPGSTPPFNARMALTGPLLSEIPIPGGTQPPPACNAQLQAAHQPCSIFSPYTLDPNMHTPTSQEWSLTVEREITKDLMLQLGYVGSQSYHLQAVMDINANHPQTCADPQGCASGGTAGAKAIVPQGTLYMPPAARPNPFVGPTSSWFYVNNSSYEGGTVSLIKRASHGLTFKTNYTFSKVLDLQSGIRSTVAMNEPATITFPFDLKLNKGIAAFNLQQQFNANFSYELPFGKGQHWGGNASGVAEKFIGGWQWNGIFTAQSGFPFTPLAGSNISGTGDTNNPDVPNRNPAFSGPVILGTPNRWYNPSAFALPTPGTFGTVSRGSFVGPGLTTLDTSLFKKFIINERWGLQFRAEVFNIANHANFGQPNVAVFSGTGINPSAGVITTTATTSRQVQFALKLMF